MRTMMKTVAILMMLTLIACTAAVTPTPELEVVKLKLNWQHGVQFLGFYMADIQGFYAEEGLDVSIEAINDSSEVSTLPQRLVEGNFDFSMGAGLVVNGQAQGIPVSVFGTILQFSPNTFFARADSDIVTIADFEGRRVAIRSDVSRRNLERLLATANLTLDNVTEVQSSFDMTPFYEGEVDIWAGFLNDEVVRARQTGLELATFPLYEYGVESTSSVLFSSGALLEDNPELAARFLRATIRGWNWAIENPTEAVDAMLEQFSELADERDFYLVSFNAYVPLVRPPGVTIGTINCERWLSNEAFAELDSTEGLCTTDIFNRASLAQ